VGEGGQRGKAQEGDSREAGQRRGARLGADGGAARPPFRGQMGLACVP
jgi:hypothetical protein